LRAPFTARILRRDGTVDYQYFITTNFRNHGTSTYRVFYSIR